MPGPYAAATKDADPNGKSLVSLSLQMTTALRPLVGTADTLLPREKKFFAVHWIDSINAGSGDTRR